MFRQSRNRAASLNPVPVLTVAVTGQEPTPLITKVQLNSGKKCPTLVSSSALFLDPVGKHHKVRHTKSSLYSV